MDVKQLYEKPWFKPLMLSLKIILTLGVLALGIWVLYAYEYVTQLPSVDNIVGAIPVALVFISAGAFITLIWLKREKRFAALSITLAVVFVLSAALFPNALRGNWWIAKVNTEAGSDGDISGYKPFTDGNSTAKLNEESTLTLKENLPVLDGALALYPVYSAIVETVYDGAAYNGEAQFTNTVKAFNALIAGERDIIFSAYASESQLAAAKAAGVELKFTPIGKEAFVFVVGKNNPVDSVTVQQIRNVFSGKTARWSTLGWREGGNIIAFQRPEGSGSQTGLQSIMKGLPIQVPQPLPSPELIGTNSLMKQISVEWKGVQPALGYTYRFFGNTMTPNPNAKFLKINDVEPSVENIKNGSYPFIAKFYAVTAGEPEGNEKLLIDWILSPQGQRLIQKSGYTSVIET